MKYWRKLLSFILIIILSSFLFDAVFFQNTMAENSQVDILLKKEMASSKGGFLTIVVHKNDDQWEKVKNFLSKSGWDIEKNRTKGRGNERRLEYLFSSDKNLVFIFLKNESNQFWTVNSGDTKRYGLILDKDFVKLISSDFKTDNKLLLSAKKAKYLLNLFLILELEKEEQLKVVIILFAIIIVFSITGFVILVLDKRKRFSERFLKFMPNIVIMSYIFIILSPLGIIVFRNNIFLYFFILFLSSYFLCNLSLKKSMILNSLIGIFIILAQAFLFQNELQLISIVGYHPSYGNRFYGIGNEFYTYMIGFMFILAIVCNLKLSHLIFILSLLAGSFVIPYYTVNFGAFASISIGIIIFLLVKSRNRSKIIALSLLFLFLALILVKFNRYILNAFSSYQHLFWMVTKKMSMNFSYFISYPYTIIAFSSFIMLFYLAMTKKWSVITSAYDYKDIILLFFLIGIFAFLLNDSGVIIITLLLGFAVMAIYYTKMVKKYEIY